MQEAKFGFLSILVFSLAAQKRWKVSASLIDMNSRYLQTP